MKLLQYWLNFFTLSVVENDVSGSVDDDITETDEPKEKPKQTVDEFIDEATDDLDAALVEKPVEKPTEPVEQAKTDDKKTPLTDDDLKPLDSKNKATNERFEKLTQGYKELESRVANYEQLEQKAQGYEQAFAELQNLGFNDGDSAQSLIEFSEYRNALKSGDVEKFKQIVANEIQQFELYTGKRINIQASGLDGDQELQQRVQRQELSEDDAIKIARLNNLEKRASIQNQTQYNQQTEQQFREQENARVEQDVLTLQTNLQKTDPDYQAVVGAMQSELQEITRSLPPAQWAKTIEIVYNAKKAALVQAQPQKQGFTPLRANSAKGGKPVFKTVDEQIAYDLDDDNWSAA